MAEPQQWRGSSLSNRPGRHDRSTGSADALARGLGWFSIALGLAEVLAPHTLARVLGMDGKETLLRACGLREIGNGIGILSSEDQTPWIWARVGGDAIDLAALVPYLREDNPQRENVGLALAAVAGVTALDVVCAQALSRGSQQQQPLLWDYSDRRGMPRPPDVMRGAARDFEVPKDMRTPDALRPYTAA